MEEKDRYEVKRLNYGLNVKLTDNYDPDWRYIIFDSVNDEELAKLETVCDWLNQKDKKIADLEAKLEQSQKERELDNSFWKQECDSLQKALAEKEKEIEEINREFVQSTHDWKEIVKEKTQDKISFAVEQLEKVKEFCNNPLVQNVYGNIPEFRVENFIDNQIKELKEKK